MSEESGSGSFELPGYQVGRTIGRGGFAVVHEAVQLSLGRSVAIKMLMPDQATERDLYRFDRERVLLTDLSRHRHVVDVIDAGTSRDGRPFIVMALYRRGSLAQALADRGPLRPVDVVSVVSKVAGALQAAHGLGIVHRDVKPENVLIADDGEPALADFGISVLADPERSTTANFFTTGHAAPEVLDRGEYSVASDQYSLASTAYLLLAGRYAFPARGHQFAQMRAVIEDPVPPIGRSDVPPALEAAVLRGMAKRPQDRYPSVLALADAMTAALATTAPWSPVTPLPFPQHGGGDVTVPSAHLPPPSSHLPAGGSGPAVVRQRAGLRALAWTVSGVLLAGAGVLGGSYALGYPPGASLFGLAPGAPLPVVTLATDMSLQNVGPDGVEPTNAAIDLYLEQVKRQAGKFRISVRKYDSATPRFTRWDPDQCRRNAEAHVRAADEVAVIGPYNSGCAKIQVPVLNRDPTGPMVVISNGSTDPGLTKAWGKDEPGKYYPAHARNFARVVTTDDVQGRAAVQFAMTLRVTKVFVLDDGDVYGTHIAAAFADAAGAARIEVVGREHWDPKAHDYLALFKKVADSGADAVYLGGAIAHHGTEVVRDKVAVLGDNDKVRLLAPDGFAATPEFARLPQSQGMFVTFPGRTVASIRQQGGAGAAFLNAYQDKHGRDPSDAYSLYGVAAAQVVLEAVRRSDGTRRGVHDIIFGGTGVTVPKNVSVLGADTRIDPATGDVQIKDVTIDRIKYDREDLETTIVVP